MAKVEISGQDVVQQFLRQIGEIQMPPLLRAVAKEIQTQTEDRILTGKQAPDGSDWAPWSEGYKKTRKPFHSLLIDTGKLLLSFKTQNVGGEVHVGTDVKYAKSVNRVRPFMGLGRKDRQDVKDVIQSWLQERLK